MPKNKKPTWADAYNKCRLNLETIEMAKKLGMSPRTVISSHASTRSEKWKAPVKEWIHELYEKRFGKDGAKPDPQSTRVHVSNIADLPEEQSEEEIYEPLNYYELHSGANLDNHHDRDDDLDDPFAE